jgi:hypothetical protein
VPLIPTTATSAVMARTGLKLRSSLVIIVRTVLPLFLILAVRGARYVGLPLRLCHNQPRVDLHRPKGWELDA